jgi:hypothetical protein
VWCAILFVMCGVLCMKVCCLDGTLFSVWFAILVVMWDLLCVKFCFLWVLCLVCGVQY